MLAKVFCKICDVSPFMRRFLWKQWYQFLARAFKRPDWSFMNYGFAPLDGETPAPETLEAADEPDRACIQLYHHVATGVPVEGLNGLEVGSGRGGGASYVKRYLKPDIMRGVDFSVQAVDFCKNRHQVEGLEFVQGDAENLPFGDGEFDFVVNVESSHCYGSVLAFFAQVTRVLKPGGHFLYADFRTKNEMDEWRGQLESCGLEIVKETDITANVVQALSVDSKRKEKIIEDTAPRWLLPSFREFAALEGSKIYEAFRQRDLIYMSYVLKKS